MTNSTGNMNGSKFLQQTMPATSPPPPPPPSMAAVIGGNQQQQPTNKSISLSNSLNSSTNSSAVPPPPPPPVTKPNEYFNAKVLYTYIPVNDDELPISENDIVQVLRLVSTFFFG
jgi:hypothetical protein